MLATVKRWLHIDTANASEDRWIFGTIIVAAMLSLIAAFILAVENVELLKNPNAQLSCNINAILNCASVMKTEQSHVFGFPNAYLGLIAEPMLITMAIGFFAGARYKKWFFGLAQAGTVLGAIFAYWLFFESVYVIQILCPWCLLVTLCTTITLEALTRYNLRENNFNLPGKVHKKVLGWLKKDYDKFITAGWIALLVTLVLLKFPDIFG